MKSTDWCGRLVPHYEEPRRVPLDSHEASTALKMGPLKANRDATGPAYRKLDPLWQARRAQGETAAVTHPTLGVLCGSRMFRNPRPDVCITSLRVLRIFSMLTRCISNSCGLEVTGAALQPADIFASGDRAAKLSLDLPVRRGPEAEVTSAEWGGS